jgi:uncharacterized protein YbjT (DUF2867 family)
MTVTVRTQVLPNFIAICLRRRNIVHESGAPRLHPRFGILVEPDPRLEAPLILVTGATGATGSELVRLLTLKGAKIRVLARDPDRAKSRFGTEIEVAPGDLERPESLDSAMRGVDRVFLLSAPGPDAGVLQGNAIEAARRADVRHVVKMSAVESVLHSPCRLLRLHAEIEQKLAASGIPFTNLRPQSFMQNTLAFAPSIASQGVFYAPAGGAIPLVDVRDIAAVAAEVLTTPGHEGATYTLTGPEALTNSQVAARIGIAIGKPVKYVEVPSAAAREAMLGMGISEWLADGLVELYALGATGRISFITDVVEAVGKKKAIAFDQFARDYAAAFSGQGVPSPT